MQYARSDKRTIIRSKLASTHKLINAKELKNRNCNEYLCHYFLSEKDLKFVDCDVNYRLELSMKISIKSTYKCQLKYLHSLKNADCLLKN
jgi:hypothetical protein